MCSVCGSYWFETCRTEIVWIKGLTRKEKVASTEGLDEWLTSWMDLVLGTVWVSSP